MKARIILKTPTAPFNNPWVARGVKTAFALRQLDLPFRIVGQGLCDFEATGSPWVHFAQNLICDMFEESRCVHLLVGPPSVCGGLRSDFVMSSIALTENKDFNEVEKRTLLKFDSIWLETWGATHAVIAKLFGPSIFCVNSWVQMYDALKTKTDLRLPSTDELPEVLTDLERSLSKWL